MRREVYCDFLLDCWSQEIFKIDPKHSEFSEFIFESLMLDIFDDMIAASNSGGIAGININQEISIFRLSFIYYGSRRRHH